MPVPKTAQQGGDTTNKLVAIDKEIDKYESSTLQAQSAALRERWKFGRLMVEARDGKGRLPNGFMARLVEATGTELGYRVQFAEAYPTDSQLSTVLESCESWRAVKRILVAQGRSDGEDKPSGPKPARMSKFSQRFYDELIVAQRHVQYLKLMTQDKLFAAQRERLATQHREGVSWLCDMANDVLVQLPDQAHLNLDGIEESIERHPAKGQEAQKTA